MAEYIQDLAQKSQFTINAKNQKPDLGQEYFFMDNLAQNRDDFMIESTQGHVQVSVQLSHNNFNLSRLSEEDPLQWGMHSQSKCVIYCHSNVGSRQEAYQVMKQVMQSNMVFVTFDFTGCGCSDCLEITQGCKEYMDLKQVQDAVMQRYKFACNIKEVTLQGFSMGAFTALKFAVYNEDLVDKIIVDSGQTQFKDVATNLIAKQVGDQFSALAVDGFSTQLHEKKNIMNHGLMINHHLLAQFKKPILVSSGTKDTIVDISNSQHIMDTVGSTHKQFLAIEGLNHNDSRGYDQYNTVCTFINFNTKDSNEKMFKIAMDTARFSDEST